MRNVLNPLILLLAVAGADVSNVLFSPFFDASNGDTQLDHNDTQQAVELLKRQGGCGSGYTNCNNLGAPGLCCRPESVCSADSAGNVGCCPSGAACTGTIGGATGTATGFTFATTTNSAQAAGVTPSQSTVSNPYYPFPYIATTYTNAAACSAAWTGCQTNLASCTAALGGNGYAVTIAAPNGGVTVEAVTTSLPSSAASSICSSLSSQGCYGLQVAACAAFGNGAAATGAAARAGTGAGVYCMGAGVAVGIAGQML